VQGVTELLIPAVILIAFVLALEVIPDLLQTLIRFFEDLL
jgi:hypothetical protein